MAINIGRFSVNNSVLINILMISILVLGVFSLTRLPQEQFNEVPFFWVNIIVPYPGVAAEDIEQTVTIKIEEEFQGLDEVKEIASVSREGFCAVQVKFEDGISNEEFARLYQEVSTRFNNVDLPDGTLSPIVDDFSSSDFLPVIEVMLSGSGDYALLKATSKRLYDEILSLPDVSKIALIGDRERRIIIDASREKLEAIGLSLEELVRAVQSRNVTVPGGRMESRSREFLLRTIGELDDLNAFESVIIRRSGGVRTGVVRVGDVARVREDFDPQDAKARFNGDEAINLRIAKVPRSNSVGVVEQVKKKVEQFRLTLAPGISVTLQNDSTIQIRDSLNVLVTNSVLGFFLLLVILLVFIGMRNALITALGIPITFAITFVVLELLGETLNSNTLFALVLVLGLIVDHAIVIIENSYRLSQEGLSLREAAIQGTNEVVVPVFAATLTTIAAFLPLMLLPGVLGKFLRVIPLVVTIALTASTFEAIVFIPSHFAEWTRRRRINSTESKSLQERLFFNIRKSFERALSVIYNHRIVTALAMILVLVGTFFLVGAIGQNLFNAEDFSLFYIDIELPTGSNRDRTDAAVREFEQRILPLIGNGEVVSVTSSVGFRSRGNENTVKNNLAQITVDLLEKKEGRNRTIAQIMQDVKQMCDDIPSIERVLYRKVQRGPPTDPPVSFRLFGDNYDELITVSKAIEDKLGEYPELINIRNNLDLGTPELRITIKQDMAARFGLSVASIGSFIRGSFDGFTATTIFKDNEEIDVIVRYAVPTNLTARNLVQLKIPTPDGRQVPFSSVCLVTEGQSIASIKRLDEKREVTVVSEAYDKSRVRAINADVVEMFDAEYKPYYPAIVLEVGGEFAEFANLLGDILRVFLVGVFLIYIILGTQFRSYTQPILILLTIPFAFVGVILYLFISGTPFSTTVLYAGVALAGIAVNDSIVLINFVNQLRKAGKPVREAVIEAAGTRLRPILLTSITTIAGLTPTALALGGESVVWGPMASTIIFGLIFSTITALIIIPSLYGILYDRGKKVRAK